MQDGKSSRATFERSNLPIAIDEMQREGLEDQPLSIHGIMRSLSPLRVPDATICVRSRRLLIDRGKLPRHFFRENLTIPRGLYSGRVWQSERNSSLLAGLAVFCCLPSGETIIKNLAD
jgi:hypothetical protein